MSEKIEKSDVEALKNLLEYTEILRDNSYEGTGHYPTKQRMEILNARQLLNKLEKMVQNG